MAQGSPGSITGLCVEALGWRRMAIPMPICVVPTGSAILHIDERAAGPSVKDGPAVHLDSDVPATFSWGEDIRREPLHGRRKRLAQLLSKPKGKAAQRIASGCAERGNRGERRGHVPRVA
jgi:hypothetical protein